MSKLKPLGTVKEPRPEHVVCQNCRAFDVAQGADKGMCRRHAPRANDPFPTRSRGDWCMEGLEKFPVTRE